MRRASRPKWKPAWVWFFWRECVVCKEQFTREYMYRERGYSMILECAECSAKEGRQPEGQR